MRTKDQFNTRNEFLDTLLKLKFILAAILLLNFSSLFGQGTAAAFESITDVGYTSCSGIATVRFPVRENYSICGQANQLRWIKVWSVDPSDVWKLEYKIYKRSLTDNDCPTTYNFSILSCRTYDYCGFGAGNTLTIENGTGDQRFVKLTIKNLPESFFGGATKFYLQGHYDYECCEGSNCLSCTQGFSFGFYESDPNGNQLTIARPTISSVTEGTCQHMDIDWGAVSLPGGCGTVTYDVTRVGYGLIGQDISPTEYIDLGVPFGFLFPITYGYEVTSRWTPNGSSREDYSLPSLQVNGSIALPDGSITVNVKTTGGVPVPGVMLTATRIYYDNPGDCITIPPTGMMGTTNSNGTYTFANINYGAPGDSPTGYTISAVLGSNNIPSANTELDDGAAASATVNLTDFTSYTVHGKVLTAMGCGLEGATISADGHNPLNVGPITSTTTAADGTYTIILPGPDNYGFYSSYTTASTTVEDSTNQTINTTVTSGVNIQYTKTNTLQGFVGGDCNAIFGTATINAYSEEFPSCLVATTTSNAATGLYQMTLPAHPMIIKVEGYFPSQGPLQGQGPLSQEQTVILDSTTVMDFIFRAPITLEVIGMPEQICSDISFPILEQFKRYPLIYVVTEGDGCLVDTGYVLITDEISSVDGMVVLDTIQISNGIALDTIIPGIPNIFSDYSKPMTLQAYAGSNPTDLIAATPVAISAVVTGSAPRGTQFTTVSPQIPQLILRDPPGDESYSFFVEGNTFSTTSSLYHQDSEGGSVWIKAKAGVEIELISFEAGIEIGAKLGAEAVHIDSEETLYEFTATSAYQTSNDDDLIGADGDMYVGAAMNITYANSDIISLDLAGCKIDKRVELVINPDSFSTKFVYTESGVLNIIIPALQQMADDPMQTAADRHRAREGIRLWHQIIILNAELKEEAFANGPADNISITGGIGENKHTFTSVTSKKRTIEWKTLINEQIAVEAGFSLAGSGLSGGFEINLKQEFGGSKTNAITTTTTSGFDFRDGDPTDAYTVDWAIDSVYGTPVFRVPLDAGQSSCPYELGANIYKPYFSIPIPVKYAGSGVDLLEFEFILGNHSELTPALTGAYTLEMISNPGNVPVRINGVIAQSWEFPNMLPGNHVIDVSVERNPGSSKYHFEGILFKFYPTCGGSPDLSQALYRQISAFFDSPCSDIAMMTPTINNGFLINQSSSNRKTIGISGYQYSAMSATDKVILEYAVSGSNGWNPTNISLIKSQLLNNNPALTNKTWNTELIPDGAYDIRLKLLCMDGSNTTSVFSQRVSGVIDRMPPQIVGVPFPPDDDYASGDEIALIFDEKIDTSTAVITLTMLPDNVTVPTTFMMDTAVANKILIIPSYDLSMDLGKTFEVVITDLEDMNGNIGDPYVWEFTVGEIDSDGDGYNDSYEDCIGSALHFDKSGYITVPHDPIFNVVEAGLDFSFEAWVFPDEHTSWKAIVAKGNGANANTEFSFALSDVAFGNKLGLFLSGEWEFNNTAVPLNQWSHVAATVDGATKTVTFYLNGVPDGTKVYSTTTFHSGDVLPLVIGKQGIGNLFDGRMDDVIIWQHKLTQAEIMATMAGDLAGNETDLVAYFDFDDYPGCVPNIGNNTLTDKSTNANNGTLTNFGLTGCTSNWATERSMDNDRDGIPDGCDEIDPCFDLQDPGDTDGDLELDCADLCPVTKDVAMDFDGTGDYFAYYLPTPILDSDFAFEAWVNPEDHIQESILYGYGVAISQAVYRVELRYQKLALFLVDTSAAVYGEYLFSSTDVPLNQWSHVAVSFDASTKQATFYFNGQIDGVRQSNLATIYSPSAMFNYIGLACDTTACPTFNGRMDDVIMWSRTLSPYNIIQTMSAPLSGSENGIEGYYDFNDGVACANNTAITSLTDKSMHNRHATVYSFDWSTDCSSNFVMGRNTDSDGDMIGDACDANLFGCPPDYAGANKLSGDQVFTSFFDTDGAIESNQTVVDPAGVIYNSDTWVELLPTFEVELGSRLEVKLDGCPD